jgi:hypothetical protein
MKHALFNSNVKTNIGLKIDPKWNESQITKRFSFCALIGILPMAQNRPIPGHLNGSKKKLHANSGGSC